MMSTLALIAQLIPSTSAYSIVAAHPEKLLPTPTHPPTLRREHEVHAAVDLRTVCVDKFTKYFKINQMSGSSFAQSSQQFPFAPDPHISTGEIKNCSPKLPCRYAATTPVCGHSMRRTTHETSSYRRVRCHSSAICSQFVRFQRLRSNRCPTRRDAEAALLPASLRWDLRPCSLLAPVGRRHAPCTGAPTGLPFLAGRLPAPWRHGPTLLTWV
jgi:hypothetical protein